MSLNGYILDSNSQIRLKLCVAMVKWLISVKNSKNSPIFANFGCFGMYRVKKMTFPLSEIAQKGQFSGSHPYGLQQKWLQILRRTTRGLVAMGHKKKAKSRTEISQVPIFDISVFLRVFLLTSCDFQKSGELWQLGGNSFWKASRLFFKTLPSFACLTLPEKRDKGIISIILMRNLPEIVIFCPKIFK